MLLPNSILNALEYRDPTQITTIVIHHSVLNPTLDAEAIATFEVGKFGFTTAGYNAYVKQVDAKKDKWIVQQMRPINKLPAAQYGFNVQGYAICVGGNFQPGAVSFTTEITTGLLDAVKGQIHAVLEHCPWIKFLIGHRDVATIMQQLGNDPSDYSTLCPGDNLYNQLDNLRTAMGLFPYNVKSTPISNIYPLLRRK